VTETELQDVELSNVFEERAEFLSKADLRAWTERTEGDRRILAKLKGPGAKLLTGPRGSGKSTLLREAYFELLEGRDALPVYVNYARSLALEPLFHRNANALQIFRQWVAMKIVEAASNSVQELNEPVPSSLGRLAAGATAYVDALAAGLEPPELSKQVGPAELCRMLEDWADDLGRRRVVLLLDDAAHAFSPQQQREFFEVYRELRTRRVSAKAAVYPGITSYSPYMHVGHEAELVEAWYRPDEEDFLETMRSIVDRRLPAGLRKRLDGREELIDYLALASFGLPRGFLVMLSDLLGVEEDGTRTPTKRRADEAIAAHVHSVHEVFKSLSVKIPRYTNFVTVGGELEQGMIRTLRRFNTPRPTEAKAVAVGIADPLGPELSKVIEMLEYAGVVRENGAVSRGVKGVFHRYELHFAIVISENALSLGRSPSAGATIDSLTSRSAHDFARTRGTSLLGDDFTLRCTLNLAPCQYCGTDRISEEAQFCMKCGRPLSEASVYEELLKASIDLLPLTENKLTALKENTAIRTVKDILLDEESIEIRRAPYVGPVWSARVHRYAEEFVSV